MACADPSLYACTVCTVQALSVADVQAMQDLYLAHYCATSAAIFRADLAAKHEALLLRHGGELVGFTTWRLDEDMHEGRAIRVLYSGDTVVHRAHWGQQALAFAWIRRMGELAREGAAPLYWLLLVKGHRTYKYLSVFALRFFPHWQQDEPELQALASRLARARFGDEYLPGAGIVRFASSRGQLRPEIALPSAAECAKAATRHFLACNPGYAQGDELVCLCELAAHNMRPLARRLFQDHG
jgi:hypothetical protein